MSLSAMGSFAVSLTPQNMLRCGELVNDDLEAAGVVAGIYEACRKQDASLKNFQSFHTHCTEKKLIGKALYNCFKANTGIKVPDPSKLEDFLRFYDHVMNSKKLEAAAPAQPPAQAPQVGAAPAAAAKK